MPNASAPNAPCVDVCESPQTTVMPGLRQSELRADDVHDALLDVAERVQSDAELRAVVAQRLNLRARHGSAIGLSTSSVGMLWSSVASVRSGRRTGRPASAKALECLRARHLVNEVEVDVEEVGFSVGSPDDVLVPDLFGQSLAALMALSIDISSPDLHITI